jgi:hypothetical protein
MQFRSSRLLALSVYGLCVYGPAVNAVYAKDPALLSIPMEHFRDTAQVERNPGDGTTTISTEKGFAEHSGPLRMVWNDEFLQAVIDARTGRKSFTVYAWLIYGGAPRAYATATFQTPNGTRSVPTTRLARETANCAVGDCSYTDHLAFTVDEESLRQLAAASDPGKPQLWHFTLLAKSGPEYAGTLSTAEVAGLLAKVDQLAAAPAVLEASGTAAAATAATAAPRQFDFGISALPVAASEEEPNRAGLLVVAVQRGSVAQKSRIIVGDILYQFDGHALAAWSDLQAAMAARAPNSPVTIKLYRGTDAMAVAAQF